MKTLSIRYAAPRLGITEKALRALLISEGIAYRDSTTNQLLPYAQYRLQQMFIRRETTVHTGTGSHTHLQLRITPRGMQHLYRLIHEQKNSAP